MKIKIKLLNERAKVPSYAHPTDAGLDLIATDICSDEFGNYVYGTGIAVEIPDGYVGLVFPRSSNCKKDLLLTNSVGIIDSGYRGEILFKYRPTINMVEDAESGVIVRYPAFCNRYELGDRIGQLIIIPYPSVEFEQVDELSDSDRGVGGYGSTGK